MTESDWLKCSNPDHILKFLLRKASDRKLRLLACEACRHLCGLVRRLFPNHPWLIPEDPTIWHTLSVAEQFADGLLADPTELARAEELAEPLCSSKRWLEYALLSTVRASAWTAADETLLGLGEFIGYQLPPDAESSYPQLCERIGEKSYEAGLLRCSFGPLPFRPITIDPFWLTTTVEGLAQGIYEERAFDRLPILADALEDSGCTDADILSHLRGSGPHVRGCWPIDLLLGRS